VLFSVLGGLQNSILIGFHQFSWIARLSAIHAAIFIVASFAGIAWAGVPGALAALVLAAFLRFLLWGWALLVVLRHSAIAVHVRGSWSQRTMLFRYTIPSAIAGIFLYAVPSFCAAILLTNSKGFGEVALYNAATSIKILVLFLPNLIYGVGISMLNSQLGPRNFVGYRQIFWNNLALTTGVALSAMVAVALAGPWILLAYGSSFADGYKLLLAVIASAAPEAIALGLYQVIQSDQRMWRLLFRFQIPRDIAIVLLSLLLAPRYGAFGLALAYGIAWTAALVSLVLLARESPLLSNYSSASQHS
jgi:O-antigen/teichoic acid export membrane protein